MAENNGVNYLQNQVFFLSDGQSQASDATISSLQELANVTAIAYGADANQGMLSKIASDGQVHSIGTNGGQLRAFLAEVGRTLTQELSQTLRS